MIEVDSGQSKVFFFFFFFEDRGQRQNKGNDRDRLSRA